MVGKQYIECTLDSEIHQNYKIKIKGEKNPLRIKEIWHLWYTFCHKSCMFLWDIESNLLTFCFLWISKGMPNTFCIKAGGLKVGKISIFATCLESSLPFTFVMGSKIYGATKYMECNHNNTCYSWNNAFSLPSLG